MLAQYRRAHPAWPVTVAPAPGGPWCKAAAIAPAAAAAADADVLIIADADVWTDGLAAAVDAVTSGLTPWAIPHRLVHRLTPAATDRLLNDRPVKLVEHDERPYAGIAGGGIVVLTRAALAATPMDPRFTGWGQEDQAWGVALHVLHGLPWRGDADLLHLWHPPQQRATRKIGSPEGQALHRRYLRARRDPAQMRALLQEARP